MAKEIKTKDGKFTFANAEKHNRAIHGSMGHGGMLQGGVGEKATEEAIIAEYDRLGGLILVGNRKVKTGSFYDFDKKAPRETPEIVFIFRDIEGDEIEVAEGTEVPIEVKAAEIKKEKKVKKEKKEVKESSEDEE